MQSTKFTIPGASAKVNYRLPVDFARAFLSRIQGGNVAGSLWIDQAKEIGSPFCAHILSRGRKVAAVVFIRRLPDGTTEGALVSNVPEIFQILRQALEEFIRDTSLTPA